MKGDFRNGYHCNRISFNRLKIPSVSTPLSCTYFFCLFPLASVQIIRNDIEIGFWKEYDISFGGLCTNTIWEYAWQLQCRLLSIDVICTVYISMCVHIKVCQMLCMCTVYAHWHIGEDAGVRMQVFHLHMHKLYVFVAALCCCTYLFSSCDVPMCDCILWVPSFSASDFQWRCEEQTAGSQKEGEMEEDGKGLKDK